MFKLSSTVLGITLQFYVSIDAIYALPVPWATSGTGTSASSSRTGQRGWWISTGREETEPKGRARCARTWQPAALWDEPWQGTATPTIFAWLEQCMEWIYLICIFIFFYEFRKKYISFQKFCTNNTDTVIWNDTTPVTAAIGYCSPVCG
jgi:hypothetical protein